MTFCWQYTNEYLDYRSSIGLKNETAKGYINGLSTYLKINHRDISMITKDLIMPWCIQRDTEKSSGFRARISMVRQFTLFTFAMGYSDFVLDISFLPKEVRYTPYIFSDKELNDLFNYLIKLKETDSKSLKKNILSVIYRLIFFCGLRPNEGREIKLEDLDLEDGTIHIKKNKTHKERIIPMSEDIKKMIYDYYKFRLNTSVESKYLFPSPRGKCYEHKWLTVEFLKAWNMIKSQENNARVRVYDLRHRYATTLMMKFLNDDEDLFNILPYMSAYMGHSNFNETAYYIHLLPENLLRSESVNWDKMSYSIPEVQYDK